MSTTHKSRAQFVVCMDNTDVPASLELHKIYQTVPDADAEADGDIRIVDESGESYLYALARFVPIKVPAALRAALAHAH